MSSMKRTMLFAVCALILFHVSALVAVAPTGTQPYKAQDYSHLIGMKGFTKEQLELHLSSMKPMSKMPISCKRS